MRLTGNRKKSDKTFSLDRGGEPVAGQPPDHILRFVKPQTLYFIRLDAGIVLLPQAVILTVYTCILLIDNVRGAVNYAISNTVFNGSIFTLLILRTMLL